MTSPSQQAVARVLATRGFAWLGESSLPTASEGTPLLDDDGSRVGFVAPPMDSANTQFSMADGIVPLSAMERSRLFEALSQAEITLITALLTTVDEEQEQWLMETDARIDSNQSTTLEMEDLPGLSRRERAEISIRVARSVLAGEIDFGPEIRAMLDRVLELRRQLFSDSLRLVVVLVATHGQRMDFATGMLRGALGLDKSIDRFEPERGWQFSTYATWWISQHIRRSTMDFAEGLRIPVHAGEQTQRFWLVQHELWTQTGTRPSNEEVLAQTNIKYGMEKLGSYRRRAHVAWLKRGSQLGPAEAVLDSDIPSTIEGNPVGGWVSVAIERARAEVYAYESARPSDGRWYEIFERRILQERTDGGTLRELGKDFDITRERIRQLEAKLLSHLRHRLCRQTDECAPWNWSTT
jgi:RNA polymerase primary sigma factor